MTLLQFVDKHAAGLGFIVFFLGFLIIMAWSDRK